MFMGGRTRDRTRGRAGGRRGAVAAVLALGLAAVACSGGGGGPSNADLGLGPGETVVQFEGAGKLHLGGTLAMPDRPGKAAVGGVLIVPTVARNNRDGYIDVTPADAVYLDLSKAITGAGMAAFRFDRRSMGVSKLEDGQQVTFDDMVADAKAALSFMAQRSGVDQSSLALVGHDIGGIIAMRVAATDDRVKSVVFLSTPGRPLVDIVADSLVATDGPASADAFRATIATLLSTGALPDRNSIRPEHQPLLPSGQDSVLRSIYSLDPPAEAAKVKVPALVVTGGQSTKVTAVDGARLAGALASAQVFSPGTTATLQQITPALPQAFDPNDHRAHGGGRPSDTATRDLTALDRITSFLSSNVGGSRQ